MREPLVVPARAQGRSIRTLANEARPFRMVSSARAPMRRRIGPKLASTRVEWPRRPGMDIERWARLLVRRRVCRPEPGPLGHGDCSMAFALALTREGRANRGERPCFNELMATRLEGVSSIAATGLWRQLLFARSGTTLPRVPHATRAASAAAISRRRFARQHSPARIVSLLLPCQSRAFSLRTI